MGRGFFALLFLLLCSTIIALSSDENQVSFDSSALKRKAQQIKNQIKQSKALNQSIIGSGADALGYYQAVERENFRASNSTCHNQSLLNSLKESFVSRCNYEQMLSYCDIIQRNAQNKFKEMNMREKQIASANNGRAMEGTLRTLSSNLSSFFNELVESNDSCSTQAREVFTSSSCMHSYNSVFTDELNRYLGETCAEDSIDSMIDQYTAFINETVINRLNTVIANHLQSRNLEGKIAEKLVDINKTLHEIERRQSSVGAKGSTGE